MWLIVLRKIAPVILFDPTLVQDPFSRVCGVVGGRRRFGMCRGHDGWDWSDGHELNWVHIVLPKASALSRLHVLCLIVIFTDIPYVP